MCQVPGGFTMKITGGDFLFGKRSRGYFWTTSWYRRYFCTCMRYLLGESLWGVKVKFGRMVFYFP